MLEKAAPELCCPQLSCSSTGCSWRRRQKINEDAPGRCECARAHPFFIYKYMGSSLYWSFIKPDWSFSWLQHASILNSEIKGSCQTFSAQSSFESIWCEKSQRWCINLIMAINSWLCSSRRCWCAASRDLDHGRKKPQQGMDNQDKSVRWSMKP